MSLSAGAEKPSRKQGKIMCFRADLKFSSLLEKLAKENNRNLSDLLRELIEIGIIAISDPNLRGIIALKKMEKPLFKFYRMY